MLYVSRLVTINDLKAVPVPKDTDSYKALPHDLLIEKLSDLCANRGADIKFGLSKRGNQMFGTVSLDGSSNGNYSYHIGFRNSYDKTLALGLVAGVRVFVCSNLCFSGDVKYVKKHTHNLDIDDAIDHIYKSLPYEMNSLMVKLESLKNNELSPLEVRGRVVELAENNIVPFSHIRHILNDIQEGSLFPNDRLNEYGVVMAATHKMKVYGSARQVEGFQRIAKLYHL
jgi:hypothetical protein